MNWTITTTEEELHHTTMVGKAMGKRITWKVGAARLQTNKQNITQMLFVAGSLAGGVTAGCGGIDA